MKTNLHIAIHTAPDWSKAWHSWALFNAQMLEYYARTDQERAQRHVAPAVAGFFKSVALGQANQMPGEDSLPVIDDSLGERSCQRCGKRIRGLSKRRAI